MVKSLIPAQRHDRIQAFLEQKRIASIAELSGLFDVSEATIRRDLEVLEAQGLLERTHGGAIQTRRLPTEPVYTLSATQHPDEKRAIGAAAAALVREGDTLLVNSGTTTTEVLRCLAARSDLTQVSVLTTNVTAALEARHPSLEVILLGGHFRPESNAVVGDLARRALTQVHADKCFIGVDGVSRRGGLTTPVSAEAEIARLMIERTRGTALVVADSSKWGVVSNFEIAAIDQVQALISDIGFPAEAIADLFELGLQVIRAGSGPDPALLAKTLPSKSQDVPVGQR